MAKVINEIFSNDFAEAAASVLCVVKKGTDGVSE